MDSGEPLRPTLQLAHLSLTTLNGQIPPDKNEDFHTLIFDTLKTIIKEVK